MSFNDGFATENFSIMVHQHAETPEIGDGHSPHPQGTMPKGELHTTRPEIRPSLEDTFLVSSPWVGFTPYWNGMKWAKDWNMDFPSKKTTWFLNSIPLKISHEKITENVCLFDSHVVLSKNGVHPPHGNSMQVWRFKENPARFISNVNPGLIGRGLLITGILSK